MRVSKQRKEKYYRIFDVLYEEPFRYISDISKKTRISRNTVAKYLKDMHESDILVGPYLSLNPASNYEEYIYLLNFSDPFLVTNWLKGIPHILQTAVSLGEWNTLIIADTLLDVSLLTGPHDLTCDFIYMIYDMRRTGIINHFRSAVLLQSSDRGKRECHLR